MFCFFSPSRFFPRKPLQSKFWQLWNMSTDSENSSNVPYMTRNENLNPEIGWASKVPGNHCHTSSRHIMLRLEEPLQAAKARNKSSWEKRNIPCRRGKEAKGFWKQVQQRFWEILHRNKSLWGPPLQEKQVFLGSVWVQRILTIWFIMHTVLSTSQYSTEGRKDLGGKWCSYSTISIS